MIAYAGILVDDGVFDASVFTDAHEGGFFGAMTRGGLSRFIEIISHKHNTVETRALSDNTAEAEDGTAKRGVFDDTAIGNERFLDVTPIDFRSGQKTRPGKDGN